jgi:thioredoxin 1
MKETVFISYKRENEDFARHLRDLLNEWGFNPWLDVCNIYPGDNWDAKIDQGLKEARVMIGLITPEALNSQHVQDEWAWAKENNRRLILLRLKPFNPETMSHRFIRINYIDLVQNESAGIKSLHQALTVLPSEGREHPIYTSVINENSGIHQSQTTVSVDKPVAVTEETFTEKVIQSPVPVIVDFWAEWCGPCKTIAPVLEKLAKEYAGQIRIAKVDVDANQALAGQFGIQSTPTLMFVKNGKIVGQSAGAAPEGALRDVIGQLLALEV